MTKIKIKSTTPIERVPPGKPNNGGSSKASPVQAPVQQVVKKEKGLFMKCIDIVKQDIREVIHGDDGVKMPESTESWEDWRDQL